MNDKMEKTTIHIDRDLKRKVVIYRSMKDLDTNQKAVQDLIEIGLDNCGYDINLPDQSSDQEEPKDQMVTDTKLSDIPNDIIDIVEKEITRSNVGAKETIIEDTLRGIRYLRGEEEGKKRADFVNSIFKSDDHPKSSWKVFKEGYKQLEGVLNQVEIDHNKGIYKWEE